MRTDQDDALERRRREEDERAAFLAELPRRLEK